MASLPAAAAAAVAAAFYGVPCFLVWPRSPASSVLYKSSLSLSSFESAPHFPRMEEEGLCSDSLPPSPLSFLSGLALQLEEEGGGGRGLNAGGGGGGLATVRPTLENEGDGERRVSCCAVPLTYHTKKYQCHELGVGVGCEGPSSRASFLLLSVLLPPFSWLSRRR